MRVLLNDRQLDGHTPEQATLGSALIAVQDGHIGQDEVISEVWVDGEMLTAEKLSEWKDRPAEDFTEARIEAPTRNTLACKGLRLASEGLGQSDSDRDQIVQAICQGQSSEAMEKLTGYLQLWDGIQQTLGSACRLLGVDPESLETTAAPADQQQSQAVKVSEQIGLLTEQLRQIKTALENGDLILLGDILDYEFGAVTNNWVQLLDSLADEFDDKT